MKDDIITRNVRVTGRVQGVGFRAFVKYHARKLALDGFVRNRTDGTVEALITGHAAQVERLIALCHTGPTTAAVERVDISEAPAGAEKGFRQWPAV